MNDLVAHARQLDPYECCGFLAGTDKTVTRLYRIKNVVSLDGASEAASFDEAKMNHLSQLSPEERAEIAFIMDAQEMFQAVKDMQKTRFDTASRLSFAPARSGQAVGHRHQNCERVGRELEPA